MVIDPTVSGLLAKLNELDNQASGFKQQWQDIKDLVRINAKDIYGTTMQGEYMADSVYDGTAIWALEQLAAALQGFLTPPSSRWFNITVEDTDPLTFEEKAWLNAVSEIIYKEYSRPEVNFSSTMSENFLDICSMGTSVVYQDYNRKKGHIFFRVFPMADCRLMENDQGMVDTMYRQILWYGRQIDQRFGRDNLPEKLKSAIEKDKKNARKYKLLQAVYPRTDRDFKKFTKVNKPWASTWISLDFKEKVDESGFDMFPYHVPRWSKLAGEDYGRSPAMTCLPDIKMLNTMDKTLIKAAQKMVDPPLLAPDDGFILPLNTAPGSVSYYESGIDDKIIPLETKGRFDIGEKMIARKADRITRSFFVDWIIREKKRERQTTLEISDDRSEMLRQMAPMLGRSQTELIGPMIARSYHILSKVGRIPRPPESLLARTLALSYTSPAAKAQKSEKGVSIQQFLTGVTQVSQINPEAVDAIDVDGAVAELADITDVPISILRSPDEISALRTKRKEDEEQQQQMLLAKEGAAATKDLAIANEKGGAF